MNGDEDKVDELTMALLFLVMSRNPQGGRAAKAFDLATLDRLHRKGWIREPRVKDYALEVTPEGVRQAEAAFRRHCAKA